MCSNLDLQKQVPCPDSELFFSEAAAPVHNAFHARNFAALDDLYTRWCSGADRFPDGTWKLSRYGRNMHDLFTMWNAWTKHLDDINTWQQARPASVAARFVEAVYWRAYAWRARGRGYSREVSKEGWELFRERMNRSKEVLEPLLGSDPGCPAPYALMIEVLTDIGAPAASVRSIFDEGVRKFPEYHGMYFAMARYYEPKWGGSLSQYERFADEATKLTSAFEGAGMYSRIYWLVDNPAGVPFDGLETKPPRWMKLKSGFEDLMRRYPSSLHNLAQFTSVACRSEDSALYRTLRAKLVGYESQMQTGDAIDVCDRRHHWTP